MIAASKSASNFSPILAKNYHTSEPQKDSLKSLNPSIKSLFTNDENTSKMTKVVNEVVDKLEINLAKEYNRRLSNQFEHCKIYHWLKLNKFYFRVQNF